MVERMSVDPSNCNSNANTAMLRAVFAAAPIEEGYNLSREVLEKRGGIWNLESNGYCIIASVIPSSGVASTHRQVN